MAFDFIQMLCKDTQRQFDNSGFPVNYPQVEWGEAMVSMEDGVALQTLICRPQGVEAPLPTILTRSCYPHLEPNYRVQGENFAQRGYIFVLQYCRGRAKSKGNWEPNLWERQDGIDTVNWLAHQPWCGRLGVLGHSYTALTGWAIADAVTGKVSSMFLEEYGTDRYVSAYEKGEFRQDVLTSWSMENTKHPKEADMQSYLETCRYMPQIEVDRALWGEESPSYRQYITSPHASDPVWEDGWWGQLRSIPAKTTIPLCIVSGWYDHHHGSTMKTWQRLSPESRAHSWLIIGGWNHFFAPCIPGRPMQHVNCQEVPRILEWFQMTLKDGTLPTQQVQYYQIGEDRWINGTQWADTQASHVLYLPAGRYTYTYDPQNPVESTAGDALLKTMGKVGSLPQPQPNYRPDVVSFVLPPLNEALPIRGKIQVRLYVRSNCPDTAFTARVMEVTPEGTAYHIRSSITTLAHETGKDSPYQPGAVIPVTIEMWDIAYTIPKGSSIRVDVSSSDFPQYHIHSNLPGLWSEQRETAVAQQEILCGEEFPSCVVLPC